MYMWNYISISLFSKPSIEIIHGFAPRATTSLTLPRIDKLTFSCVDNAITGVPSSINAIVPCLSSPPNPSLEYMKFLLILMNLQDLHYSPLYDQ